MINTNNLILRTDSYKASHAFQYPPKTEYVYSYIESRGGEYDRTVFFGPQIFYKDILTKPITKENVEEAEDFFIPHGEPFYKKGWLDLINKHGGYIPLNIRSVPEGAVVPNHNVLLTSRNTDKDFWWLTSALETPILRSVWYGSSVATISYRCKQIIKAALEKSSDDMSQLSFKLHDFGARGVSSGESAAIGGAAHLVNFMGSDTVEGILCARKFYNEPMAGFSIPAAEHSTITSWGKEGEVDAYRNMLKQFAKQGAIVAVVSDSYDMMNAAYDIWGGKLKKEVIDSGATIVVRPDSGDPLTVPVDVIHVLGERFGFTVNSKGYKVLPSCVRVIQGDGITVDTLPIILNNLLASGWAADNIAFGMGGGLLQMVNRDTFKFAMKCSAVMVDGKWRDVYKEPKTDSGKNSKRGTLALIKDGGVYKTVSRDGHAYNDLMYQVFHEGDLQKLYSFSEVRENSNK